MTRDLSATGQVPSSPEARLQLVGTDPATEDLRKQIAIVAPTRHAVLILGETGTGKDIVAELIRRSSSRAERPWRAVNCSELRPELAASELFGHEAGAFTGAARKREGLFRSADKGTLFLDEIGDLPLEVQTQLLRAIEQGEIRSQGADRHERVDVRVLAATNADVDSYVLKGKFRQDLLSRFVCTIEIPPLRERLGDIEPLARHFVVLHRQAEGMDTAASSISDDALDLIRAHPWHGNVRELENAVKMALTQSARAGDHILEPRHFSLPRLPAPTAGDERAKASAALRVSAEWIVDGLIDGALEPGPIPKMGERFPDLSLEVHVARAFIERFEGGSEPEMEEKAGKLFGYGRLESVRAYARRLLPGSRSQGPRRR